ncbi:MULTISPECIES: hypothetical protein [unclassified Pseudoxanthomonas]|uniref:hypothetical protein n=1 Tax=unclassified Pseudoxanthomonas TaxID=2645906 RepID=UPI003076F01E
MNILAIIGALGSLLGGLATAVLAYVAWVSRKAWQQQVRFQREMDVAEALFVQSKLVADLLKLMFYPYSQRGESGRMPKLEGETEQDWALRKNRRWADITYNEHSADVEKLRATALRAGAVLGVDYQEKAFWLVDFVHDILAAGREMEAFRKNAEKQHSPNEEAKKRQQETYSRIERRQWSDMEKLKRIDIVYSEIERMCRDRLMQRNKKAITVAGDR